MKKSIFFPWYVFLLPLFYILHANNSYFSLIAFNVSARYLFYYLVLAGACFIIGRLFLRNNIKAGIWAASFLIIFFFFGSFYDFLHSLRLPSFLSSYTFLLSLIVIILIVLLIVLRKREVPLKLNRFFLLLFVLLVLFEAGELIYNYFTGKEKKENLAGYNQPPSIKLAAVNTSQDPDIFFIIFDEYTSSLALGKYYHFNNSAFDSSMLNKGFYISVKSQSNYNSTPLSIGSCFDMQYFQRVLEKVPNDALTLLRGARAVKKSFLPALLHQHGYELINYGLCDLDNAPVTVTPVFEEFMIKAISLETLWGRIQRDIIWNITVRMPGYKKIKPADASHIERNKKNYTRFINELGKESDKPRFVMGHLLLPRRPAAVDRYGHPRMVSMDDYADSTHDRLYLEQLIYANTLIDSLAQTAVKARKRPLVLIIEGDHGNRYAEWGRHIREKQFMNLNMYYFSDRNYSSLYDSISPVNTFRVVFNKYFNTNLPLLKDSTILLD